MSWASSFDQSVYWLVYKQFVGERELLRVMLVPTEPVLLIVENDLAFAEVLLQAARRSGFKALVSSSGAGVALNLSFFAGYQPQAGDVFLIVNNSAVSAQAVTGLFTAGAGIDNVTAGTVLTEGTDLSDNFLGSGKEQGQVVVYADGRQLPPLEERYEETGRLLLDGFVRRRLIPLGCVRVALFNGADNSIVFAADRFGPLFQARRRHRALNPVDPQQRIKFVANDVGKPAISATSYDLDMQIIVRRAVAIDAARTFVTKLPFNLGNR